ncbi:MAG: hypothetical protein K5765_03385 [Clostridia bacterium]|nr:hypothetical protein [Clostridia bacterium]
MPSTSNIEENVSFDDLDKTYNSFTGRHTSVPSTGDVNILVIPIKFTNSKDCDMETIEKAFNGTNEETGWYSLNTYYKEVSFGKLDINATIMSSYETDTEYDLSKGGAGEDDYKYLSESIAYYDEEIDYSQFDANNDGYIDCVYLMYLAPYDKDSEFWWAYDYDYAVEEEIIYDGVKIGNYIWASYEYLNNNVNETLNINTQVLTHETGRPAPQARTDRPSSRSERHFASIVHSVVLDIKCSP